MTTINRATWTDDDGSGATGTIINNARLQGDIYDKVDQALATLDAKDASQDTSIAGNGPHKILSTQHTDVVPATLVAGDLLRADATGKLARLAAGANGQLLNVAAGLPAWTDPPGLWQILSLASATLQAATGTFTVPGGAANFTYQYLAIGKLGMVSVSIGPATTSAATAWVGVLFPAGFAPAAASQNLLALVNPATLTVTIVNVSPAGGIRWYPAVSATGTIPATSALYLFASIFFPLP